MVTSKNLLEKYLINHDINIELTNYIQEISNDTISEKLSEKIFDNIIIDSYDVFSEDVKEISDQIKENHRLFWGRKEKIILKNILDYENYDKIKLITSNEITKEEIYEIIRMKRKSRTNKIQENIEKYFDKLKQAIIQKNNKSISDYINFLYSKILIHSDYKYRSVFDIYLDNKKILEKEFDDNKFTKLYEICKSKTKKLEYQKAVEEFNKLYYENIIVSDKNLYEVIALKLNQRLFNNFESKNDFYSYIYNLIKKCYAITKNHRSLIIKIENIIYNNNNIKWEIYSYLTIFAENFIKYREERKYYNPEDICKDYLEYKYSTRFDENIAKNLKDYYEGKMRFEDVFGENKFKITISELDYFKNVYTGYQFIDCLILKNKNKFENTHEIEFIENQNELLIVYYKNEIEDTIIPCPVCGSLKVSGNSYSNMGIKSWECKNDYCIERSKSNRGKRYSIKSNEMQNGVQKALKENIIDKDLIAKWRKDVVPEDSYNSLFEMIVKYYSYKDGNILFLNYDKKEFKNIENKYNGRTITSRSSFDILTKYKYKRDLLDEFKNSEYIKKIIYDINYSINQDKNEKEETSKYKIFNKDCLTYLKEVDYNSIHHMVTSPPYYNARDYSTWKNLYNYLNEMYMIIKESFNALIPGGVFYYNIGDIFDNPNTIVKSTMGKKRIPLGAYMIFIFKKVGFELLDNIIWDKGETQSNRHKNDGNFTPYYQKPANCYEHMFVFKKPGKLRLNENPSILNNIQKFSPVIKINSKGENILGHTAPYPIELPLLSIKSFTLENEIVFDPFLGSGTTICAAIKANRIGTGTELNEKYFKLSQKIIRKYKEKMEVLFLF